MTHDEIWANSFQNPVPSSVKAQAWGFLRDANWDRLETLRSALLGICESLPEPDYEYGVCTTVAQRTHLYACGLIESFAALWPGTASAACSYPIEGDWIHYDTQGKWKEERLTRRLQFMHFMIDCIDLLLDEGWPDLASVTGNLPVQPALRTDSE